MTSAAATADASALDTIRAHVGELLAYDRWPRERLLDLQRERIRSLVGHAVARSPYYRETLGADALDADLADLPTLPKSRLIEEFDRVVTEPGLGIAKLAGRQYPGGYRVFATSGSTGVPCFFVFTNAEFAYWTAVSLAALARAGVTPEMRISTVGAPGDVHITRQLFAAFQAGRKDVSRLDVTMPVEQLVDELNAYQPEALLGYASVLGMLAEEQLEGRLSIAPRVTAAGSEVLTDETAARIAAAWGRRPVNVYAATEAPGMAYGSLDEVGMHVMETMVVLEVVDDAGGPVEPGTPGAKVLLTNLVNRAQPLIRYELADSVVVAPGPDPSGRPYLRLERVDGRSDDILRFGGVAVHPHRLRSPFTTMIDVRQYQIVHTRDGALRVDIVPRRPTADLAERVRAELEGVLAGAGAPDVPVRIELVAEIAREPGHAGKLKLIRAEA